MKRKKKPAPIETVYIRIGKRLKYFREQRGFTQQDMSEIINLSRASIVNIENGNQRILAHHLFEFAAALNVKPEMLVSRRLSE